MPSILSKDFPILFIYLRIILTAPFRSAFISLDDDELNNPDINIRNKEKETALMLACNNEDTDENIIKLLLDNHADPNIRDDIDYTPLMNAAKHKNTNVAKILIDYGGIIESKDKKIIMDEGLYEYYKDTRMKKNIREVVREVVREELQQFEAKLMEESIKKISNKN